MVKLLLSIIVLGGLWYAAQNGDFGESFGIGNQYSYDVFYLPKDGGEPQFSGHVNNIRECRRIAQNRAKPNNDLRTADYYYCCRVTAADKCAKQVQ